ncbi:hypothetical protein LTR41_004736 [Exophiala xenobiotica]|nr:hypothetical protein LTR41_004736 [Exophiala xenobiotica]
MDSFWNKRPFRPSTNNWRGHRVEALHTSVFGWIVPTLLPSIFQIKRYEKLSDEKEEQADLTEAECRKVRQHSDIESVKANSLPSISGSKSESRNEIHASLGAYQTSLGCDKGRTSLQITRDLKPKSPMTLTHPDETARIARSFVTKFQGHTAYAVKANDSPDLLSILSANGVTWFDVASINEVRLVLRCLPESTLCFMNPVKSEEAIKEAYFVHGVRSFSLDSSDELEKILRSTATVVGRATDLNLFVRLRVLSRHAKLSLESKFGVSGQEASLLLQAVQVSKNQVGLCFHVGSQVMGQGDFAAGLQQVYSIMLEADVHVRYISVGGGFAVKYPDMEPPSASQHLDEIHNAFHNLPFPSSTVLIAEPGRCLSAWHHSMLLRVEKRRGSALYVNDGVYGTFSDAGRLNWPYFTRLVRESLSTEKSKPFTLYGPTCDTLDKFGPWNIPGDVKAGDYLEVFGLGAYGSVMRTRFNGCDAYESMVVQDEPIDLVIERYYQSR